MHRVVALALADVVAFDLSIAAQVFGSRSEDLYDSAVCAAEPGPVPTTTGFALLIERDLVALEDADTVVVPGYEDLSGTVPDGVAPALRSAHDRGARLVSICTGAFALAAAGLLDGLRATTHWEWAGLLAKRYPAIEVAPDVLYVDEGQVLTSAGVAAGIDLCLHIVRRAHAPREGTARRGRSAGRGHRAQLWLRQRGLAARALPPGDPNYSDRVPRRLGAELDRLGRRWLAPPDPCPAPPPPRSSA